MTGKLERIPPKASMFLESMRDIGYSLPTAIADIIDNSITAGANRIEIHTDTHSDTPAIGILDNGCGMSREELLEALRPGARSPLDARSENDLGRFGLGLKTASFSQCRRLVVLTRKDGVTSCASWDLDVVAEKNDWVVEFIESYEYVRWSDKLGKHGTLLIWQKLDRLVDDNRGDDRQSLIRQIDETGRYIELVFHRFLAGAHDLKRIQILLNNRDLIPFDPFHSKHPATIRGPEDVFTIGNRKIYIQSYTLPHHSKVSKEEWEHYAGVEGYTRNQGFYVYRAKRLIIYGTWFRLARQSELTKLARVRIDMPNSLDVDWKIDVKKASAQPPPPVRERLKKIVSKIAAGSKRVYTNRGVQLVSQDQLPVWTREQEKNKIFYRLSDEHPVLRNFAENLSADLQRKFKAILDLVGATIPIATLFADVSSTPEDVSTFTPEDDTFSGLVESAYLSLKGGGVSHQDIELMMSSSEPYQSNWEKTEQILKTIEKGDYKWRIN